MISAAVAPLIESAPDDRQVKKQVEGEKERANN